MVCDRAWEEGSAPSPSGRRGDPTTVTELARPFSPMQRNSDADRDGWESENGATAQSAHDAWAN